RSARSRWVTVGVALASLSIAADRPAGVVHVVHARGASVAGTATADLLNTYCVTCHNGRLKTAGLQIDGLDAAHVADHAQQWEKIAARPRTGEMRPPGRPRPDAATSKAVAAALEQQLDAAAAATPQPGRVPVHRLNRTEYANAIRDLLGVEIDARA